MKQCMALCLTVLLLMVAACPVMANTTTDAAVTTTTLEETTTQAAVTTTEEVVVTTTTETSAATTTTTAATTTATETTTAITTGVMVTTGAARLTTQLTIIYENSTIMVRVVAANGQPVSGARIKMAADTQVYEVLTTADGLATVAINFDPAQIICSMDAFQGVDAYYEGSVASIVRYIPTTTTTGVPTTTTTTAVTTTVATTAKQTFTEQTWTTGDPAEEITVTEIVTGTTILYEAEPTTPETTPKSNIPQGFPLTLMIVGGVLLVAAIALLCVFLFRAPRVEEDEETDAEGLPAEESGDETDEMSEEEDGAISLADLTELSGAASPAAEKDAVEEASAEQADEEGKTPGEILLEDLFRE